MVRFRGGTERGSFVRAGPLTARTVLMHEAGEPRILLRTDVFAKNHPVAEAVGSVDPRPGSLINLTEYRGQHYAHTGGAVLQPTFPVALRSIVETSHRRFPLTSQVRLANNLDPPGIRDSPGVDVGYTGRGLGVGGRNYLLTPTHLPGPFGPQVGRFRGSGEATFYHFPTGLEMLRGR